jgi:hypothetical protein
MRAQPPSQARIRIVADKPSEYVVRVEPGQSEELPVPADGRVTASIPQVAHISRPKEMPKVAQVCGAQRS